MKHNDCGNEFIVTSSNFLKGKGYPKCKGKRISMVKTKTHNEFVERVFQLVGVQTHAHQAKILKCPKTKILLFYRYL